MTAIVGPNACGKSTLLGLVGGLHVAQSGELLLADESLGALSTPERAARLVVMPQRPAIDVSLTVERLVGLGRLRQGHDAVAVDEAIERMGLSAQRHAPLQTCSVGQAQRAHAARVLAQSRSDALLVLDEPTAPLDHHWADVWWSCMREHAESGGAVLVAVHDLSIAASRADDAWLMDAGKVVAAGPASEVLEPVRLGEVFGTAFEWGSRSDGSRWLVPAPE